MGNRTCREFGQDLLKKRGLSIQDYRLIASEILDWSLTDWLTRQDEVLDDVSLRALEEATCRYLSGEPLAYISGRVDFYGRRFLVTGDVLIPRPETELLVDHLLKTWPRDEKLTLVDLGTGSGCLAITLAKECPNWTVHAVDISGSALKVAQANAKALKAPVHFHLGSWLEAIGDLSVSAIVSNPPYISRDEVGFMDDSVIQYEPHLALFAEENGLAAYKEIFQQMAKREDWKYGMMECGFRQGPALKQLAHEMFPSVDAQIGKDYEKLDRWIELKR
ncbi:peptide chain release factor N(5)-glutamine methyltransferase [Atopobacter sp. AH10]|uniref:peptide chain release factor N(5)-glutamine methyltransferase n=1 Tax=Atopobacter sp. AH10 TaxID=2315861 RepID=UPI000EF1CEF4|nr:peptide chain release factor N(5)-glutamine methyltransferase [Atopobacter sp. AH10]RLK64097.1 peptide chain release factor N(5)-glutamine methyltransferase [Atopobacter sp. AH10]